MSTQKHSQQAPTPVIEFNDWNEVFTTATSLISVCQSTALLLGDNPKQNDMSDFERSQIFGSNEYDIFNVLDLVKRLLPYYDEVSLIKEQNPKGK